MAIMIATFLMASKSEFSVYGFGHDLLRTFIEPVVGSSDAVAAQRKHPKKEGTALSYFAARHFLG